MMEFLVRDMLARTNIEWTIAEIHILSYFYHWSREDCWKTPCTERGIFVDRIRQQLQLENGESHSINSSTNKYRENI